MVHERGVRVVWVVAAGEAIDAAAHAAGGEFVLVMAHDVDAELVGGGDRRPWAWNAVMGEFPSDAGHGTRRTERTVESARKAAPGNSTLDRAPVSAGAARDDIHDP
ncbi:MAG TPA: hypothetical protein VMT69_00255 [Kineosporiaceae bacterium]|nr:hypothetical protein [Kineosporiaceae bacterium]